MDKAEVQEALVTLYLRLNGYFTSGFIVHSPAPGREHDRTRCPGRPLPHSAEPERGVGVAADLDQSNDLINFIIGEVKSRGEQLRFNEALRCSPQAVSSILRWWGHFSDEERQALVTPVAEILTPRANASSAPTVIGPRNARVRAILFSPERDSRRNSQAWFIPGPPIFAYIWECLRPPAPRPACSTTYDFGRWGLELESIVRYFKDQGRRETGGFPELLKYLGVADQ